MIQWGKQNANGTNSDGPWSYSFDFITTPIVICQRGSLPNIEGLDGSGRESNTWNVTKSSFYYDSNAGYPTKNTFWYIAIGY